MVGDKRAMNYMWLRSQSTFQGKVYSVQIDERESAGIAALGMPNYPSLAEIPDEIDYVMTAVPRQVAPRIIADCAAKKVSGVMLFTSGFSEVGDEDGNRLEQTIANTARAAGLALIGPNCMGIYHPRIGLRNYPGLPTGEAGTVGFIGQSGTHTITFSLAAPHHGLKISKAVSFGNAAVLDASDYLDYLATDDETRLIGMYLEGDAPQASGHLERRKKRSWPAGDFLAHRVSCRPHSDLGRDGAAGWRYSCRDLR